MIMITTVIDTTVVLIVIMRITMGVPSELPLIPLRAALALLASTKSISVSW